MVMGYSDVSGSVNSIVSRLEEVEDDMQVCKNDVDTLRIEQVSMGCDVQMLEALTLGARGGVLTQYITNTLQGNGQRT
jgi:hypothetical protein